MMHRALLATVGTLMLVVATLAVAAPPTLLTYQGALTDAAGNPANATYSMTFGMYNGATGGAAVWLETMGAVKVVNGVFTVVLGGTTPLPAGLTNCKYLQVTVGGTPMLPRHRLTSVPYALESANATTLGGQGAAYYRNASNLNAGTVAAARLPANGIASGKIKNGGIAAIDLAAGSVTGEKVLDGSLTADDLANSAVTAVKIKGGAVTASKLATDSVTGVKVADGSLTDADLADGAVTGPKIGVGEIVEGNADGSGSVFGARNTGTAMYSRALEGVSTGSTGTTYGVKGQAASSNSEAAGVVGSATAATGNTYGVLGNTSSASGTGVYGVAFDATGNTYGVQGTALSTSGSGVVGTANATTGSTIGVWGIAVSTSGTAVYGSASAMSGTTYGVKAQVNSPNGIAVYAYAVDPNAYGLRVESGKAYFEGYATFAGGHGDLAENYRGRDVEAGDVVVIGEDGVLAKCAKASDATVAGIVSTSPSMKLNGGLEDGDGVAPLALVGRVACKVDASERPIKPGDLLVTSDRPGHAMKCPSKRPAAGAVLGKALEGLDKGTGIIQVLVTLR